MTLLNDLTDREREILQLLAQGKRNDDIATQLFISPQTVQTHVRNILGKLRVHSKLEAVAFAVKHGAITGLTLPTRSSCELPDVGYAAARRRRDDALDEHQGPATPLGGRPAD